MSVSESCIACANPARLMTRLCRHWGHKFPVELSENRGSVAFPAGRCEFMVEPGMLQVSLAMPQESQTRMQQVVADHLQRMAGEEALTIDWRTSLE